MPSSLKTPHYLSIAAALLWALYVITDYLAHHPLALEDIAAMPFAGSIALVAIVAAGTYYRARKQRQESPTEAIIIPYRGITAFACTLLAALPPLIGFLLGDQIANANIPSRALYFSAYSSLMATAFLLIITSAYATGDALLRGLKLPRTPGSQLIPIASGLAILGTILTILGLLNLLISLLCWVLILLPIALNYQQVFSFVRNLIWTKKELKFTRAWGLPVLVLLIASLGVYLVGGLKTFPVGYDGAALYMNLSMLVADSGSLPYGGQAFGWSVIMSLGEILFGSLTISILLSNGMGLLVLLLLYRIAREYLTTEMALLAVLLTATAPYFAFHWLVDEKVDLAFTFIALAAFAAARLSVPRRNSDFQVTAAPQALPPTTPSDGPTDFRVSDQAAFSRWWLIVGLLGGYAFTVKYTALILAMALFVFYLYRGAGRWAFIGGILINVGFLFASGIYRQGYIDMGRGVSIVYGGALLLAGILTVVLAFNKRVGALTGLGKGLLSMAVTFLMMFAPWAIKHVSEHGGVITPANIIRGESAEPPLEFIYELSWHERPGQTTHPSLSNLTAPHLATAVRFADFQQSPPSPPPDNPAEEAEREGPRNALISDGVREDVQRYLGYEPAPWRYLSLPYDLSMTENFDGKRFVDIGFLGFLLLPLILLLRPSPRRLKPLRLLWVPAVVLYLAGVLYSLASPSSEILGNVSSAEAAAGYAADNGEGLFSSIASTLYAPIAGLTALLSGFFAAISTLPAWAVFTLLTALAIAATVGARQRLRGVPCSVKSFGAFLGSYALLFWMMGNGVIWYAMPLFVLAPVLLLYFFDRPERFLGPEGSKFTVGFSVAVIGLAVVWQLLLTFTSPFDGERKPERLFRAPFVRMATDFRVGPREVQDQFGPASNTILDALNEDRSKRVYRAGTELGHFIKVNDRRVFSDPVLVRYGQISSRLGAGNEARFFDMLKAQGYGFVLFDLGLGDTDRTPEQTLKKKFVSLARTLLTSPKVRVVATDNLVEDPNGPYTVRLDGKPVKARLGIDGKTVRRGSVILFEIK